jgi:hypothetical protein
MGTSLPRASGYTPEISATRDRSEPLEPALEPLAPVLELRPPSPEPVSPELVLVDPELARRERARLRDPAPVRASTAAAVRPTHVRAAPAPTGRPRAQPARSRPLRHSRLVIWAVVLALGVLGLQYVLQHESPQPVLGDAPARNAARTEPRAPNEAPPVSRPQPSIGLGATTVRTLAWAPVAGATGYELELFRGSRRVLVQRTTRPRLTLPERWRHGGRLVELEPGRYRWNVWALGSGGKLEARPVVRAQILIAAR